MAGLDAGAGAGRGGKSKKKGRVRNMVPHEHIYNTKVEAYLQSTDQREFIRLKLKTNKIQRKSYKKAISQLLRSDYQDLIKQVDFHTKRLRNPDIVVKKIPRKEKVASDLL